MVMSKPVWMEYKKDLKFDFPNLPYYQEGDLKLTQSSAILRHLARKNHLYGNSDEEMAKADMLADLLGDYRDSLVRVCYNPQFSMEMLDAWKSGTGDFQVGSSLKTRLDNLER